MDLQSHAVEAGLGTRLASVVSSRSCGQGLCCEALDLAVLLIAMVKSSLLAAL